MADEEYGLVVISALIEYPAGGNSFLSTHACHVTSLPQLETEVLNWKQGYEKDGFKFKDMLITHVPKKLCEPQKS